MLFVSRLHVIYIKSQMEFIIPQIVRFLPVPKPGQLQPVLRCAIPQVSQNKGAVRSLVLTCYLESQGFFIKSDTLLQIEHVEIVVVKRKFHISLLFKYRNFNTLQYIT